MLEESLIENCAPTLASLKPANLFSHTYSDLSALRADIRSWNRNFREKDIQLLLLKASNGFALIYVYRRKLLARQLRLPGVPDFLRAYGYESVDLTYAIARLGQRIRENNGFPHEIGIFLGYPLGDVKGFIDNAGANSLYTGCWKVYHDPYGARRTFARFKKCRDVYTSLWRSGRCSVTQLAVAD